MIVSSADMSGFPQSHKPSDRAERITTLVDVSNDRSRLRPVRSVHQRWRGRKRLASGISWGAGDVWVRSGTKTRTIHASFLVQRAPSSCDAVPLHIWASKPDLNVQPHRSSIQPCICSRIAAPLRAARSHRPVSRHLQHCTLQSPCMAFGLSRPRPQPGQA